MNFEYEKEFLKKLESSILNYKEKLYNGEYSDRLMFSLLGLDEMHNSCGFGYMFDYDDFVFKHMSFAEHINNISLENNIILNNNIDSFREFYLNDVLSVCEFIARNFDNLEEKQTKDIENKYVRVLVNDFFRYNPKIGNKDIFDRLCREKRIMDGRLNGFSGITFFDSYSKNNDYVCIGEHSNNYQKGCSIVHESGHVDELLGIDLPVKSRFLDLSPYKESFSHSWEFLMHDFLIEEGISKDTGQLLKSNAISCLLNHSMNSIRYFSNISGEEINPVQEVVYSCGMMLGFYLNNCSKEEYELFRRLHYDNFNIGLFKQIDFNKDKMIKVLSKEIEKVRK